MRRSLVGSEMCIRDSHGRGVFAFLDGLPAGLKVDRGVIDADLARRQHGYGRGGRMAIELSLIHI